MKMKRRVAWLCLLIGCALPGHADTSRQLVVHKKDGSKVSFVLSSYPEISFSNRTLQVAVGTSRTSFQIDEVAEYNFEDNSTAPDLITGKSVEGTEMTFLIYDETAKRVQVGNSQCAINRYTSGTLTIPQKVENYSVVRIGEKAFSGCSYLKAIIVPNTAVSVYGGAFENCPGLEHIILRGSISKLRYGSNIATNNGVPSKIPIYVRKDLVEDYKKDTEWARYNIKGYRLGDANDDDKINVLDIAHDANKILGNPRADFNFAGGDANEDGKINVLDIATIANVILGRMSLSRAAQNDDMPQDRGNKLKLNLNRQGKLELDFEGDEEFMAFQFKANLPDGVELDDVNMAANQDDDYQLMYNRNEDGSYTVMGYSASRTILSEGPILNMKLNGGASDLAIDDILFATTNEEGISFARLTAEAPLSIETPAYAETPDIRVNYSSNDLLHIDYVPASSRVLFYAVSGQDYSNRISKANGQAEISLESLPQGVYIIKVDNQSLKIIRK